MFQMTVYYKKTALFRTLFIVLAFLQTQISPKTDLSPTAAIEIPTQTDQLETASRNRTDRR
jgi:hypothetical protein